MPEEEPDSCTLGAIPALLAAFTAIIPTPELAADLVTQIPKIPVILPNMMLAVLLPELGFEFDIVLESDFTFDLPEVGVDVTLPDFAPIIELLLGMVAITMPPLELALKAIDPSIPMPTIPTDIPAFIAEKLPVPPLTAEASVALASCLVEIVEGFMP
tara:strand:+ start:46208 stop:46681 length:474 start_codon:yes stop_codon:yes gene_type:complete